MRLTKAASIFDSQDTVQTSSGSSDVELQMRELGSLLSKEMTIWWDEKTLKSYLEKSMIPRVLRLKK